MPDGQERREPVGLSALPVWPLPLTEAERAEQAEFARFLSARLGAEVRIESVLYGPLPRERVERIVAVTARLRNFHAMSVVYSRLRGRLVREMAEEGRSPEEVAEMIGLSCERVGRILGRCRSLDALWEQAGERHA